MADCFRKQVVFHLFGKLWAPSLFPRWSGVTCSLCGHGPADAVALAGFPWEIRAWLLDWPLLKLVHVCKWRAASLRFLPGRVQACKAVSTQGSFSPLIPHFEGWGGILQNGEKSRVKHTLSHFIGRKPSGFEY